MKVQPLHVLIDKIPEPLTTVIQHSASSISSQLPVPTNLPQATPNQLSQTLQSSATGNQMPINAVIHIDHSSSFLVQTIEVSCS